MSDSRKGCVCCGQNIGGCGCRWTLLSAGEEKCDMHRKRCGNCRHWGTKPYEYYDEDDRPAQPVHYRAEWEPAKTTAVQSIRLCGKIVRLGELVTQGGEDWKPLLETLAEARAFTTDGSGYKSDLWTREDFSCELFEPKEAT